MALICFVFSMLYKGTEWGRASGIIKPWSQGRFRASLALGNGFCNLPLISMPWFNGSEIKGVDMASKSLPKVVSEKAFRTAVEKLRVKEKKNTRERDKVSALRRGLPMMEMKNEYVFEGPEGKKTLLDLFEGRKQLVVYHFMYHPKDDSFCTGCSFVADHIPHLAHLHARNTSFVFISHGPLKSIKRHKKRIEFEMHGKSIT
jgi:hypothetical protein